MKILFLLAAAVLAIVAFRMLRSSKSTAKPAANPKKLKKKRPAAQSSSEFHAVSIRCGPGACDKALALRNKRFLSANVRQFPLTGCTAASCQCKFEHYRDRRDEEGDKRAPAGLSSKLYTSSGKLERRMQAGRRETDNE